MLRIGEFAELSTISIHMLRNYDKIGLLIPKYVDEESGYRFYDKEQLVSANQIIALKSMGFGLEEIKGMMARQEEIPFFLEEKLQERQKEMDKIHDQIRQIKSMMNDKKEPKEYMLSIARKTVEAMWVASFKGEIDAYYKEGILWGKLATECNKNGIHLSENEPAMAIYHGINNGMYEVEVQFPIHKKCEGKGELNIKHIPEREVVSVVFKGSYSQIASVNVAVAEWLEKNKYEIHGQTFTIYHNSPGNCADDKDFITELCFPVREKQSDGMK